MRKLTTLLLATLLCVSALAQSIVRGTVKDQAGNPLPGAFISAKGSLVGVSADADGKFEIKARTGDVLEASFLGMIPAAVTVDGASLEIVLEADDNVLEETVVVGYGVTRKRDLAGSVAQVKTEDVHAGGITSTAEILRGRAAGVSVRQQSFEPGGGITVRVRGSSTIEAENDPLYIVDGIQSNVGNQVSPEDIESIEILKDAAATAIYGARGANGVILITTKHGSAGKISVDYSYNFSGKVLQNPWKLLDAEQTIKYNMNMYEANGSAGDPPYTPQEQAFKGAGTDWIREMTRFSSTQTHAVSVQGGSDKIRGAASFVKATDQGIVKNTDFDRISSRVNLDFNITPWLRAGISAYAAKTVRTYLSMGTNSSTNNAMYWMFLASPLNGIDGKDVFGKTSRVETVYAEVMNKDQKISVNNAYVTVYAEANPIKDLTLRAQYSYSAEMSKYQTYYDRNTIQGQSTNGQATSEIEDVDYQQLEGVVTWHHNFAGAHDVKLIGGSSWQKNVYNYSGMGAENFTTDEFSYNNMGAGSIIDWVATARSDKINLSFFTRAEYVLMDKYIVNASYRADASSNFGTGNKWGHFFSASAAWQIGDEPWMAFIRPAVSSWKLRASWGQTGNDGIGTYKSLRTYAFQDVYLGGTSIVKGMYPQNTGNPALKWETTTQLDIGTDISFLKGKVEVNFDWYDKLTTDLLNEINISTTTTGIQTMTGNNGSVRNTGVELFVKWHIFDNRDFSWSTTLNASHNTNKVVSLGAPTYYSLRPHGSYETTQYAVVKVGEPLSSIYGYVFEGILQEGETYSPQPASQPGDPKFKDLDGDGVITEKDRKAIGCGEPKVVLGWGNTLRWKDFDFTLFFDASIGNDLLNVSKVLLEDNDRLRTCLDRWTKSNPSNDVMRGTWKKDGGPQYGSFVNSRYVEKASFFRLTNIEIGYSIPWHKLGVDFIKGLRVFVGANRLFTITGYSGFDPEVSTNGGAAATQGLDYNAYPAYRQFNAGARITF